MQILVHARAYIRCRVYVESNLREAGRTNRPLHCDTRKYPQNFSPTNFSCVFDLSEPLNRCRESPWLVNLDTIPWRTSVIRNGSTKLLIRVVLLENGTLWRVASCCCKVNDVTSLFPVCTRPCLAWFTKASEILSSPEVVWKQVAIWRFESLKILLVLSLNSTLNISDRLRIPPSFISLSEEKFRKSTNKFVLNWCQVYLRNHKIVVKWEQ